MPKEIELAYDGVTRTAVLTFPNGRELTLENVSEEKAKQFHERHAGEFQKRDLTLHSVDGHFNREETDG
jgi:hypothetical protein